MATMHWNTEDVKALGLFKKVRPALEHLKGNAREHNRPSPKELPSCWHAFLNQRVQAQPSGTFIEKASSDQHRPSLETTSLLYGRSQVPK